MLVVDASFLATALGDDGADGDAARARLAGAGVLAAPDLIDLEVASVCRRLAATGHLPRRRAALALSDLVELPMQRVAHTRLLPRCWELRDDLAVYEAVYVALAETLGCTLITANPRLEEAAGIRCEVEVLRTSSPARSGGPPWWRRWRRWRRGARRLASSART